MVALGFLSMISPAFNIDDVYFFNYMNNVADPHAVFYHRHYVQLVPELAAYALKGLPLAAQAVLYRVVPYGLVWMLFREVHRLLRADGRVGESVILSAAIMSIVWWFEPVQLTNLTWSSVTLVLLSITHVVRVGLEGRRYSAAALIGFVLTVASTPFGLLLVIPLLLQALRADDAGLRHQTLAAAIGLTAIGLWLSLPTAGRVLLPRDLLSIVSDFRAGFTGQHRVNNLVVVFSSAVLLIAGANSLFKRAVLPSRPETLPLAWMGLASVALVLATDRVPENSGAFGTNHVLPTLMCALLVVTRWIVVMPDRDRRALSVGIAAGVAAASTATVLLTQLRGPLEATLMRYQFLRVAEEFRRDCRNGDAMVFEHEDTSPVVLCRAQPLAVGRHSQLHVPPSVGLANPDTMADEGPVILVFEPFVATRQRD